MAQRDVVVVTTGAVIGFLALGALLRSVLKLVRFGGHVDGDKETEVTLSTIDGVCVLGKATHLRVGKSKHLTWNITNYCTDGAKTVSVGNFRKQPGAATAGDCAQAGADYPFEPGDPRAVTVPAAERRKDGSIHPKWGRIKLKVKGRNELGDDELTYRFDVCLNGVKADPVLVVER